MSENALIVMNCLPLHRAMAVSLPPEARKEDTFEEFVNKGWLSKKEANPDESVGFDGTVEVGLSVIGEIANAMAREELDGYSCRFVFILIHKLILRIF